MFSFSILRCRGRHGPIPSSTSTDNPTLSNYRSTLSKALERGKLEISSRLSSPWSCSFEFCRLRYERYRLIPFVGTATSRHTTQMARFRGSYTRTTTTALRGAAGSPSASRSRSLSWIVRSADSRLLLTTR